MVYAMGLFSSLSQHMMQERRNNFKPASALNQDVSLSGKTCASVGTRTTGIHETRPNDSSAHSVPDIEAENPPWGAVALKQGYSVPQQLSDSRSRGHTGTGPRVRLSQPILLKPDFVDTANASVRSTNNSTSAVLQPAGVPVDEEPVPIGIPTPPTVAGSQEGGERTQRGAHG